MYTTGDDCSGDIFVSTDTAIRILTPKRSLLYGSHPGGLTP